MFQTTLVDWMKTRHFLKNGNNSPNHTFFHKLFLIQLSFNNLACLILLISNTYLTLLSIATFMQYSSTVRQGRVAPFPWLVYDCLEEKDCGRICRTAAGYRAKTHGAFVEVRGLPHLKYSLQWFTLLYKYYGTPKV